MLLVQDKACSFYEDLSKGDDLVKPFSSCTVGCSRFMNRYNFHDINMTGEDASADTVAVIHCIGLGCQSLNPQEIQRFKQKFCVLYA